MFPEHRELISKLKSTDRHFTSLFDKHNELDQQIKNFEARIELAPHEKIEELKKEKLRLKDQIYSVLKQAGAA